LRDCSFVADGEADRDQITLAPSGAPPPLISVRGNYPQSPGADASRDREAVAV
jgi:hypothetical protein